MSLSDEEIESMIRYAGGEDQDSFIDDRMFGNLLYKLS